MDSEHLAQQVRARFEHNTARQVIKEKYQAKMLFAYAGGMWRAGPDLINILKTCTTDTAILEDIYGNPVRVVVAEITAAAQQRWQEQMTAWLIEYEELNRQR